jgi:hypothetical protein
VIKFKRMKLARHVEYMGEMGNEYKILVRKHERKITWEIQKKMGR